MAGDYDRLCGMLGVVHEMIDVTYIQSQRGSLMIRFTGDWTEQTYEATAITYDSNGWVVPTVTRYEAERIVAEQARLLHQSDGDMLMWAADRKDKLGHWSSSTADLKWRWIDPNEDGTYTLDLGWVWSPA